ncbi:MAG: hypothetical protein F4039_02145 [Gammaproteobacteria bacterium]|nr:hypothetical protein [Gammaproteobacteria bacterium]
MSEIENQIQGLILKTLDHEVTSDDIDWNDLLLISILDSVSTLALVTGLEDAFDVIVEDEELTEEMLTSTRSIAQYIYEKLTTDTHSFVSE